MSSQFRVGVIGCGEAAQILHLPTLDELREQFTVTALCDVSKSVTAGVGARWPNAARYSDFRQLVKDASVDAVVVANPDAYHAGAVIAAIEAGKHVLVEKPICLNLREVDEIIAVERNARVVVQVGYMRRYAPAFLEAVKAVTQVREKILYARVRDILGPHRTFIDYTSNVHRPDDISREQIKAAQEDNAARVKEAVGPRDEAYHTAYRMLLSLNSHTLSAMRELIGMPQRILYAAQKSEGDFISAAFDYGHFVAHLETGHDEIAHFDSCLEVVTPAATYRVDYDTPYVRHQPARLVVKTAETKSGVAFRTMYPTRNDSFVAEWRAFYRNIVEGLKPKTTVEDARNDLILARDLIAAMP